MKEKSEGVFEAFLKSEIRTTMDHIIMLEVEVAVQGGGVVFDPNRFGIDRWYRDPNLEFMTFKEVPDRSKLYNNELIGGL